MKQIKYFLIFLLTGFLFTAVSCSKNDDNNNGTGKNKVEATGWTAPVATSYQYNMTYIGQFSVGDVFLTNEKTEVGAFYNNECRGKTNMVYDSDLGKSLCYLTIYSNVAEGEIITIKVFDATGKQIYDDADTFSFISNGTEGDFDKIVELDR